MQDIQGQKLNVGDKCAYVKYDRVIGESFSRKTLFVGHITHFTPKKVGFKNGTAYPEEVCIIEPHAENS